VGVEVGPPARFGRVSPAGYREIMRSSLFDAAWRIAAIVLVFFAVAWTLHAI
jgi:hypothetical protein